MLYVTIKRGEKVYIKSESGEMIATIELKRLNGGQVTLGFESNPENYLVMREGYKDKLTKSSPV